MTEIKRPNYFTAQFLVEKDFTDEQAYHLTSRRRHNRVSHTSGVADGLAVTLVSGNQVQVAPGMAIDQDGREIVLDDPVTYSLGPRRATPTSISRSPIKKSWIRQTDTRQCPTNSRARRSVRCCRTARRSRPPMAR